MLGESCLDRTGGHRLPVGWGRCGGGVRLRRLRQFFKSGSPVSGQHAVVVIGDQQSVRGCNALCSCGWKSKVFIDRLAHMKATAQKWAHVDAVSGAKP